MKVARVLPLALGALMLLFALLDIILFAVFKAGGDWAPLWAGARAALADPGMLYDFERITLLQRPILGETGLRPFVYPPSAVPFIAPFALLPFTPSLIAVVVVMAGLFIHQAVRIGAHPGLLLAPPFVLAALVGQISLLIGALAIAALARLGTRPLVAGALLGLAASIKPTLLILAPLALIAGGHYRALFAALLAGMAVIAVSMLWLGVGPWLDWVDAVPRFQALFMANESLVRTAVTPYAFAARHGMASPWITVIAAATAIAIVIMVFRRSTEVPVRLVAMLGGAVLITPYAMNYELVLLAPAVMSLPLSRARDLVLPAVFAASLFATVSVLGLIVVVAWFAVTAIRSGDQPRVERRVDVPA